MPKNTAFCLKMPDLVLVIFFKCFLVIAVRVFTKVNKQSILRGIDLFLFIFNSVKESAVRSQSKMMSIKDDSHASTY